MPLHTFDLVAELPGDAEGAGAVFYHRRDKRPRPMQIVNRGDLREALLLAGALTVAVTTGRSTWDACSRMMARTGLKLKAGAVAKASTAAEAVLERSDAIQPEELLRRSRENLFRQRLLYAGEITERAARVAVELESTDASRLTAALERGRGAVIWVDETYVGPLMAKRALHEAGFMPRQISARGHGISQTRFGIAALNRYHLRAENRYLAERLVFRHDEAADVTRRMLRVLKAGGLVTLTNGRYAGSSFIEVPMGPGGYLTMATTALRLAVQHGVPLFTMAAFEVEPFARYRVELGAEIGAATATLRSDREAVVAGAYAVRDEMLARLRRFPEQYPGMLGEQFTTTRRSLACRHGDGP